MNLRYIALLLVGGLMIFSACNEEEDIVSTDLDFWENALLQGSQCRLSDIDARTLAAEYAPGSVITDGDFLIDQNLSLYIYEMTFDDSVQVNIYLNEEPCALYEIEGAIPPFTYEIEPPLGLVTFQSALAAAEAEVTGATLLDWQLSRDFNAAKVWVYTFEFNTGSDLQTIRVDAGDGTVI
ncbi:PepSY domain-containing protein [Roseivirga sp. BDSF3-8]|uniref:PepSY domain-containing protein n=1 Tax=Roseivirga sp. BDSF3-8 TaxID=3241598 RepID=UPI003531E0BF